MPVAPITNGSPLTETGPAGKLVEMKFIIFSISFRNMLRNDAALSSDELGKRKYPVAYFLITNDGSRKTWVDVSN